MAHYPMVDGSQRKLVRRVGDGSIITRFDKTPVPVQPTDVVCPHFLELKWAVGCPFDCAWCYLKGTLRFLPTRAKPRIKDLSKVSEHVTALLEQVHWYGELLNTGELADSLMCEGARQPFSTLIGELLSGQSLHKALFVTKSYKVDNLLAHDYQHRIIVSFSLNAEAAARRWEHHAPPVGRRIEAATMLSKAGYEVRVRIDPIVPVVNWAKHYMDLVDRIFAAFVPARITLGSLRGLQSTVNGATDKSWTRFLSEQSNWGKKIAFHTRYVLYKTLLDHLRDTHRYRRVALCKETVAMWQRLGRDYKRIACNCMP